MIVILIDLSELVTKMYATVLDFVEREKNSAQLHTSTESSSILPRTVCYFSVFEISVVSRSLREKTSSRYERKNTYFSYSEHVALTGFDEQRFPIVYVCVFKNKKYFQYEISYFVCVVIAQEQRNVKKDFQILFEKTIFDDRSIL